LTVTSTVVVVVVVVVVVALIQTQFKLECERPELPEEIKLHVPAHSWRS